MPKPLLAVDAIYDCALRILEEDGVDALSARNLAAALKCSTRTLYDQVGKREDLIAQLMDYYFGSLDLAPRDSASWQDSARTWAMNLRGALLSHPNLSRLMTLEHREPITRHVTELLKVLLAHGFDEELALRSCRVLVHIVMNLTLAEISAPTGRQPPRRRSREEIRFEDLVIARSGKRRNSLRHPPEVFRNSVDWVITGIESELQH
jgi:AcrR family transcriptional regulator